MNDADHIRVYTELLEAVENLQPPTTDEAWEERQLIYRLILDTRKKYVDSAYQIYLMHGRKPWCDVCEKDVVWRESFGWEHVERVPVTKRHLVNLASYNAGYESEIQKRLKFEI